ncbi:hypothetical protein CQW23_26249 [Capsicum baccatum]|uniref:Retrotransposon gag domain-containing protein n=1 Tax=Capsicum baccatum TaxID=33114 RepID=A0A2G2VNB2_CAPBA|nr:hypothetical protein CQW23_26249 [Capsicum baccatum]
MLRKEDVEEEPADHKLPHNPKKVDLTKVKDAETTHGVNLTTAERHARDESFFRHLYGMTRFTMMSGGRIPTAEELQQLDHDYPMNRHAWEICGVGVYFEEPLDDDVPTDDDRRLPDSDDEETSDDDSYDDSDEGGKLKSKWSGPFKVSQVHLSGVVELENEDGSTFKAELKEKLSRMYEVKNPNAIFFFKFRTHFGGGKSTGFGLIYDSIENAKKYKPKYRLIKNAIRLRLFPLSVSGEANLWLNGLTPDSITNWRQLKDAFLERFFPPSKRAQLRDEITNFRQLPTEALHVTWERFKTKLMQCPNHHMTNVHLMEILYRALNSGTKPVVDNAAGGSFMDLTFVQASNMLDRMTKQSRAWHTRDSEVASPTLSIGMSADQRRREEEREQDMAHMKTQLDLLTKHLLSGKTEKVKAVALKGRDESDSEEEANYLNNQGGFRGNAQGNQGRNYYDKSGSKDQGSWKKNNEKSGLYVPPGRRDTTTSNSGSMEDMMAKLLKGVEATSAGVKEVIDDLSSMKQLVDSHSTSIKQIEQQLSQLSAAFNQRKAGTLPSDTVQNPRNDGSCMAITTRSGKVLETSAKGKQVVDEVADMNITPSDVTKGEEAATTTANVRDISPSDVQPEKVEKQKQKEKKTVERTLPYPPPPFPQRLKKVADDTKFSKFMNMLKQLTINVPLVEALEQMPGYTKFMKDLLTKKRAASYDLEDNVHQCNAIATRSLVQKKADPGAFTIPCTIGSLDFAKALCDLGASINLMPLSIYRKLGLGDPTPTNMRLVMADRSIKRPVGILNDVLVKVSSFIFPADFVILDCKEDSEVPIILGRPFLATGSVLIDMKDNELLFRINDEVVRFDICKTIKQPSDMNELSVADVHHEDTKALSIVKQPTIEPLSVVLRH